MPTYITANLTLWNSSFRHVNIYIIEKYTDDKYKICYSASILLKERLS